MLRATDVDAAWLVDEDAEHDIRWRRASGEDTALAELNATASDLLLYLYKRVPVASLDARGDVRAVEVLAARNYTA